MKVALALVVVLLAGCGGGDDDPAATSASAKIDVTVTVWPSGLGGDETSWLLQCEPTGGDHPDPDAACATLTRVKNPFEKPKPTPRCDEIPGASPEVARIQGTFRGKQVNEMFDRSSGCVFERWDRLAPVFPTGF